MGRLPFINYLFVLGLWSIHCIGYSVGPVQVISPTTTQLAANDAWKNLTPAQKQILAPLANEWDNFVPDRRQKWLVIANNIQKMSPDEQKRVQEKMQAWTNLTPQQRLSARENYLRSNKVQPEKRSQKWQEYQQLSEEQKLQLARSHEKKKIITNLPTPAESRVQPLRPLKTPHVRAPGRVIPGMSVHGR